MRLWGEEEGGGGVVAFIPKIVDMALIRRARILTGRHRDHGLDSPIPSRFNSIDRNIPGLSGDRPSGWDGGD